MGIKAQSEVAQKLRLNDGRYPVHGTPMYQVSKWSDRYDSQPGERPYTLVSCPRGDCDVVCKEWDPFGPAQWLTWQDIDRLPFQFMREDALRDLEMKHRRLAARRAEREARHE